MSRFLAFRWFIWLVGQCLQVVCGYHISVIDLAFEKPAPTLFNFVTMLCRQFAFEIPALCLFPTVNIPINQDNYLHTENQKFVLL